LATPLMNAELALKKHEQDIEAEKWEAKFKAEKKTYAEEMASLKSYLDEDEECAWLTFSGMLRRLAYVRASAGHQSQQDKAQLRSAPRSSSS